HVVHVDQLVLVGELAFEEVIHLRDDLAHANLLPLVHLTRSRTGDGIELRTLTAIEGHRLGAAVLQRAMRKHHLGKVDSLPLATEVKESVQVAEEDRPLLYGTSAQAQSDVRY